MERLQKIIAASGYTSRRKAEELIKNGHVYVNGEKVTELGTKVKGDDEITIDGVQLKKEDKVYYLLNKPSGYVSTVDDDLNRKKVVDLIETNKRIYPIGRLDYDTTGLLLLTNDGDLANILMHPSHKVAKTYVAKLNKIITKEDLLTIKNGLMIDNILCKPVNVRLRKNKQKSKYSTVEITLEEGRNHIVKNIFSTLGYDVKKLNRIKYDFLELDNLGVGEYRELTIKEVKKLYQNK